MTQVRVLLKMVKKQKQQLLPERSKQPLTLMDHYHKLSRRWSGILIRLARPVNGILSRSKNLFCNSQEKAVLRRPQERIVLICSRLRSMTLPASISAL